MYYNEEHKKIVEERVDKYTYIGSYNRKEETIDGKNKKLNTMFIRVKCPYCNKEYDIRLDSFKRGAKCNYCCNYYENSFAYYIQVELGEPLNKYWDWEKNDVNPYCISKGFGDKVWIKCTKTDYHDSYLTTVSDFKRGCRCPYCVSKKVHTKDSFGQWLINTYGDNAIEKYWSKNNILNPFKLAKNNNTKEIWILCQNKEYHNDYGGYKTTANIFYQGNRCSYCHNFKVHPKDSFAQWLIDEFGEYAIEKYWSPKNTLDPFKISPKSSNKKVWILCQEKDYHNDNGGYLTTPAHFLNGNRCPYCSTRHGKVHAKDSFGQWAVDNIDKDFMIKYWSSKNTINPFEITIQSRKKIILYCQEKDYHNNEGGYETTPKLFYNGIRCGYCGNQKVHMKDSFGYLYPEKAKYWSPNNDKSPYEVAPHSGKKYKFICEKCGEEFEKRLSDLNCLNYGVICKECGASQLEQSTKEILDKYNIKYKREYSYDDLFGIGNKNLRFDFYLLDYNLLIECQGIQHKEWQKGWQTKKDFERQLEHDRRKKEYAKQNNINLLEIWYYDINNIENILIEKLHIENN